MWLNTLLCWTAECFGLDVSALFYRELVEWVETEPSVAMALTGKPGSATPAVK